ncbi:MAG: hypothetical protein ABSC94_21590 [Polyangiaceae bacterium]
MSAERRLEGNGAGLLRERALAKRVQGALERLYQLDRVADVGDYVRGAEAGEREALLVYEADDGALEVSVRLPRLEAEADLDTMCQIIEGVSHFVYVVERARAGREASQLELEMQAEVDKWVVLGSALKAFDAAQSALLRARLYERVAFMDAPGTEVGDRYRVANDTANRFLRRVERDFLDGARFGEIRSALRHFFELGQEGKLRLGRAA